MSFFTSLTGLDAANADLGIISNNIANVSTYGFKQSSAQFGDIYATSPLQNATSTIGQGVLLKGVTQDFSQGNITSSSNSLDMAIQGQGFFMLKPNLTANTQVYTRDGSFSVNNNRYVVDSAGQYLQVFPVNSDGSVVATGLQSAQSLQLPTTSGLPKASSQIQLGVNLPSDATIIPQEATYTSGGATYAFDPNNSNTYNQSTSITVYDSLGNPSIATIYYVKTSNATPTDPTNKWQTYIYIGGNQINPALLGAQDTSGKQLYINQFGQTSTDPSSVDSTFNANAPHALYYQDQQTNKVPSAAASFTGGLINGAAQGFNFGSTDSNPIVVGASTMSSTVSGNWLTPSANAAGQEYNLTITPGQTQAGNANQSPISVFNSVSTNGSSFTLTSAQLDNMLTSQQVTAPIMSSSLTSAAITASTDYQITIQGGTNNQSTSTSSTPIKDINGNQIANETGSNSGQITLNVNIGQNDSIATIADKINAAETAAGTGISAQVINTGDSTNPVYQLRIFGETGANPTSSTSASILSASITGLPANASLNNITPVVTTATFAQPNSLLTGAGAGTFDLDLNSTVGGTTTALGTVSIPANSTLSDVVNLVNAQTSQTGVTATILPTTTTSGGVTSTTYQMQLTGPAGLTTSTSVAGALATQNQAATAAIPAGGGSYGFSSSTTTANGLFSSVTTASQLASVGIGYTGSALNGNLTFYSMDGSNYQAPLTMTVANTFAGNGGGGGFTGSQFLTGTQTIGNTTSGAQGISTGNLFKISVDGSDPVVVSLPSSLDGQALTGEQLAAALTTAANNAFGDSQYISVSASNNSFTLYGQVDANSSSPLLQSMYQDPYSGTTNGSTSSDTNTLLSGKDTVAAALASGIQIQIPTGKTYTPESLVAAAQQQVDANVGYGHIQVGYDTTTRSLTFKPYTNSDGILSMKVTGPQDPTSIGKAQPTYLSNSLLGFPASMDFQSVGASSAQGTLQGSTGITPNGNFVLNQDQRRYGIQVVYQKDSGTFQFLSGTTGQNSSITITPASNTRAADLLGISNLYSTQTKSTVGSGLPSTPATAVGSKSTIDISGTFDVTSADNTINVTVNGVQGQVTVPPGAYTGGTFATAIQNQINEITDANGNSVGGVSVTYNAATSNFTFTTGTTGSGSIINVVGPANFGLANCTQTLGSVPNVTILQQATDASGNLLYIDANGNKTTTKPANLPNWSPLYLTPGELTFNTAGNLISPQQGAQYTPYDPQNGANPITLNVNYGKYSTQYSQPFSVLSLSQDGYTSGSLSGINIDSTGVVRATYTNGQQQALGKVVLANFSSPTGLKQLGNSDYVATSLSGPPTTGEAGSSGFGTIQGGALEESNVDMTSELVALITAQRNFQANAKAIETDTQLTSTIINIRS